MLRTNAVEEYSVKLKKLHALFSEMSLTGKLSLSFIMALSIGLLAQVRVFLPWTPVPLVMTQLGIITYASIMGRKWGVAPVAIYVLLGVAGISWFAGNGSGLGYLLGPTGGYLIGFIISAWFVSNFVNSGKVIGNWLAITGIVAVSQLLIYLPGLMQLNLWLQASGTESISFHGLMSMGFYPFIIGDILKVLIASLIIYSIKRK